MSIKIMSKVWEQSSHEGSPLLLLLALADHASDDGVCWPGIPRLAYKTRKTERHTKRLLVKLEESGEVYIAREVGRGNTNMYYITLGFNEEEMVHTLIKRFEFKPDKASRIAKQIIEAQIKGDAQDTFSDDEEDKKGDIQGQGKVTPEVEKVTPRDEKSDIAMSPESSLTVIEPSVENRQKDSVFPKTPKSPIVSEKTVKLRLTREKGKPRVGAPDSGNGGDADERSVLARNDGLAEHNKTGGRVGGKGKTSDSGKEVRRGKDDIVERTNVDDNRRRHHAESVGSTGDDKADPLMMSFERRTAAVRAGAGNWADASEDAADVAETALTRFCAMQGEVPNDNERQSMLRELSETLKSLRVTVGEISLAFDIMVKDFGYRVGNYNVFQGSFKRDLATCIRRARGKSQRAAQSDRHARYDTPAARASQEAREERMASRPPPVEDDKIGAAIKRQLQLLTDKHTFETWVKPTSFTCDDGALVITAPDAFTRDWLENRVAVTIRRALNGFTDAPQEVRFEVGDG